MYDEKDVEDFLREHFHKRPVESTKNSASKRPLIFVNRNADSLCGSDGSEYTKKKDSKNPGDESTNTGGAAGSTCSGGKVGASPRKETTRHTTKAYHSQLINQKAKNPKGNVLA